MSRDGGMRFDRVPNAVRKSWGKVTSPASAGDIGLGSCVDGGATGTRRYRGPACVREPCGEPTARSNNGWAVGMRNRTEQNSTPTEVSLLSRRVQESSARSIDRITQREGAYPCWADRSESSARSYAVVPGSGTDPPGF